LLLARLGKGGAAKSVQAGQKSQRWITRSLHLSDNFPMPRPTWGEGVLNIISFESMLITGEPAMDMSVIDLGGYASLGLGVIASIIFAIIKIFTFKYL